MLVGFKFFSQGDELAVVVSPASMSRNGPNGDLTSPIATATPSGGRPPYTYAWSRVSGDVFTINTPANNTTTFTGNGTNEFKLGTYRCVVTDDNMDVAQDTVRVNFRFGNPQ